MQLNHIIACYVWNELCKLQYSEAGKTIVHARRGLNKNNAIETAK